MKYRREVDGLRALAVVPVILFHAGFNFFSGGFVGVDIFFVISGYLITTILLSEHEAGAFSIVDFYERRARRILPALFFVLISCAPFAWMWLLPSDMKEFSKSLLAVSFFSSNIFFWLQSGYFDTAAELKPLLHTWSLAVEEQFYIIFPLFLMLAWRLGKRLVVTLLIVAALASLAMAHWSAIHTPTAGFFLLHTRAWELAIGSLIAFHFANTPKPDSNLIRHQLLSLVGLLLITYSIFAFSDATPFPSLYTLIPTVGAALIILFAWPQTYVGKLLGSKAFVGIGLLSYSAYLWHQPIFAFARLRSLEPPSLFVFASLSVASLALAYLSWRFVERPFRQKAVIDRRAIFIFAIVGSLAIISMGLMGKSDDGLSGRFKNQESVATDFESNDLRAACENNKKNIESDIYFCTIGDTVHTNSPGVAVIGDSHSEAILPAFDQLGKIEKKPVHHLGLGGCPPLLGVDIMNGNWPPGVCKQLAFRQYEFVKQHKIEKVFLVARWSLYTESKAGKTDMTHYILTENGARNFQRDRVREIFVQALRSTIQKYKELGAEIYLVEQVPQQRLLPAPIYHRFTQLNLLGSFNAQNTLDRLSITKMEHLAAQEFNRRVIRDLSSEMDFKVIDLDSVFCNDRTCPIGDTRASYYMDRDHINGNGARLAIDGLKAYF